MNAFLCRQLTEERMVAVDDAYSTSSKSKSMNLNRKHAHDLPCSIDADNIC